MQKDHEFASYERNGSIIRRISLVALVSMVTGLIASILTLIIDSKVLETIAVSGFMAFILPVLLLVVAMTAGFHTMDAKRMGLWNIIFYFLIFPFAILWFLVCVDGLLHFLPNYHAIGEVEMRMSAYKEANSILLKYGSIIYVTLLSIGVIMRKFKQPKVMMA